MSTASVGLTVYAVIAASLLVLAVAHYRWPSRVPSGGRLVSFVMATGVGRWFVLLSWWWVGWHVFVR